MNNMQGLIVLVARATMVINSLSVLICERYLEESYLTLEKKNCFLLLSLSRLELYLFNIIVFASVLNCVI